MQRLTIHFTIAVLAFLVGVNATTVWMFHRSQPTNSPESQITNPKSEQPSGSPVVSPDHSTSESPEAKAVRIAEEFIAQNGYTDLPPNKENISHETVEFAANVDELLKFRYDTLERKAYGIMYRGRMGTKGGWTVVFRNKQRYGNLYDRFGRAVSMDKDFRNLLVEHKMFPLANVDKKL